jgi:hypothetical protein
MDVEDDPWTQDFVPAVDHPEDPAGVYHVEQGNGEVGEAGHAAKGVSKGGVGVEVCL